MWHPPICTMRSQLQSFWRISGPIREILLLRNSGIDFGHEVSLKARLYAMWCGYRFSYDGRYVYSRDYLTLKVWDTAMERMPVKTISINNKVKGMLCELYESDSIFDKFELTVSPEGNRMLTGSYGWVVHIIRGWSLIEYVGINFLCGIRMACHLV